MPKLQDSVFSILKTTSLSQAVFSFLQPTEDFVETPLGGILRDAKYGWLALGPKFCVIDLRSGLKVAAKTFGNGASHVAVTNVIELPQPLTNNSQQLIISLEIDDGGLICVLHINGSQLLRCIETDVIITKLALCDDVDIGPFSCFDGLLMAGTQKGEVLVIDFNRSTLLQALKDIAQGNSHLIRNESNPAGLRQISIKALHKYEIQGELPINNDEHFVVQLNEDSFLDNQYIFRNPDGTVRMKAKRDHVRVTVIQYIPQLGSLAVGYNFGAFQLWNILDLMLEFTSQVNVECLPVTHFGFQEPCDDPRAFCYLWVVFSETERFEEHEFPFAVMYSLTYQGKRMLVDNKCLYQEFSSATVRFQVELGSMDHAHLVGGRCISTHTFSINTMLGEEGEDTMLNLCQLVWECWGDQTSSSHYGMLLFDLDQWYKDHMPSTYQLQSNTFMSTAWCSELGRGCLTLDLRLDPSSLSPYSHATRLEEHFYPNSLQYNCVCLNTSEAIVLHTMGIQRQIISSISSSGPSCLLTPGRLYTSCMSAGLLPAYRDMSVDVDTSVDEQRKFLLSVALEARMSQFLKRCAQDWATGTHTGVGCTLTFLVDWAWKRAIELKENAKELISPLFTSATLPDRNVIRCLEHCVQQLSQLTGLLDAILTKCCNLVVPEALSEIEEKYKGIGTVSLYFQVIQWFLRVGLLPERNHPHASLPYPAEQLYTIYKKRREKLHRIQGDTIEGCTPSPLLYVDQLIINEFGGKPVYQIWIRAGSECGGLYPPPSLYALLKLYLLTDISEEHKHSLLLYLLFDYSMLYDDTQYETVIRRLMQFPPMFGLSTTLVRATQAFWHLDHRDFHFALDQLQCLTGNTLSDWQHQVVLSSLLAQKKSQAALQYLHVRKPAPIQNLKQKGDSPNNAVNGHDKLEDWQSCCNLYLARGLVYEALDVVRMCVHNASCADDKIQVLNYFFKGCRKSGQLSKVLQVSLLPLEEDVYIKYLRECNEPQTSDILIMYYLQQARYLEAEQYNKQIKSKSKWREMCRSVESMNDVLERESARDVLVDVMCGSVPNIANTVARFVTAEFEPHVLKPKPMSVYVKPKSPKNTFTYKSSFIQDTIENASETWINKPKTKKGLKRALTIDETPFICTPKLYKTMSFLSGQKTNDSSPAKRVKLDFSPKTPKNKTGSAVKVSQKLSEQIATLLDMPDVESPRYKMNTRPETPHSILKTRRLDYPEREVASPMDSRYLAESDDEMETASNHTHYSDSTNKHLRFTIPTPTDLGPIPSPVAVTANAQPSHDTTDHGQDVPEHDNTMESPPKKLAVERIPSRKSYKDTVKARRSLSTSANSSLTEDPNASIESIADIPITLINPRYSGERRTTMTPEPEEVDYETNRLDTGRSEMEIRSRSDARRTEDTVYETTVELSCAPKTPKGRRSIRTVSESTPIFNRSRSGTPERQDSPVVMTPLRNTRVTRSRSRTPEISPRTSPLPAIPEMPKLELETDPHPTATVVSIAASIRNRSRTPERVSKMAESPRLEVIAESPTKQDSLALPTRRSLRSRSRTPEVEVQIEQSVKESPRNLRSRSKTPEKLMSPKTENVTKNKKSLSRIVLEANTFSKTKQVEKMETESTPETSESVIECTPMKTSKQISSLMDVTFSPIVNKSILQSSHESISVTTEKIADDSSTREVKLSTFSVHEVYTEKSVLHSYQSSIADDSASQEEIKNESAAMPMYTTSNEDFAKSVLHSYESSIDISGTKENRVEPITTKVHLNETETGKSVLEDNGVLGNHNQSSLMTSDSEIEIDKDWKTDEAANVIQKEKEKIVEIEREINEIEGDMSDDDCRGETDSGNEVVEVESAEESENEEEEDEEAGEEEDSEDETSESNSSEVISVNDSESDLELQVDEQPEIEQDEEVIEQDQQIESEQTIEGAPNVAAVNVELATEIKSTEISESVEVSNDPLNQAHLSIMTDDNSNLDSESIRLHLSDESATNQNDGSCESRQDHGTQVEENADALSKPNEIEPQEAMDRANFESVITDKGTRKDIEVQSKESKVQDTDVTSIETHVPLVDENVINANENKDCESEKDPKISLNDASDEKPVQNMDIENNVTTNSILDRATPSCSNENENQTPQEKDQASKQMSVIGEDHKQGEEIISATPPSVELTVQELERQSSKSEVKQDITETIDNSKEANEKTPELEKVQNKEIAIEKSIKPEVELSTPRTRRRKSTASNKSDVDVEDTPTRSRRQSSKKEEEVVNTPRKIAQSMSEKSDVIPETPETASPRTRRRSTTPNTEVRRILTRRASKEMSEKDDSLMPLEELTPRRRTRATSKKDDDTASVASDVSLKSTQSKASDEEKSVRKGRKTFIAKPELTVIPETSVEEKSQQIDDYSTSRRVTRHQKALLERSTLLSPKSPARSTTPLTSYDESSKESFMERVELLDKADFEARRASSETKVVRAAKIGRSASVDVVVGVQSEMESPMSTPTRGRRASFTRAVQALHTPKGRRTSTDIRKGETESNPGSPASEVGVSTPARRSTRRTSTQSATSTPEVGKRSRKGAEKNQDV
ncbi:unnamed protein product [Leptosia nina]|uniref:Protein ELYS n=1 Tax=Leptosia nina TaxID=320188 RepID=A0AAV1JQC3_9NEOP